MAGVSGTIGSHSIEGYVREFHSRAHLCTPGQTVSLMLDPSFPHEPAPSDEMTIYINTIGFLPSYPTAEQCGFVYATPTTIGYAAIDVNSGIVTVAPVGDSFSYYYQGVKYTAGGALTLTMSFPISGATEIYYIIISDGVLSASTTQWEDANTVVKVATLVKTPGYSPAPNEFVGRQVIWAEETVSVKVLTGYVQKVSRSKPSFDWLIEGMDTYQRVQSYFIEDQINIGYTDERPDVGYQPLTTKYWIGYLMDLCGAGYTVSGPGKPVPQGVQLGLRTVHESLQDILAYSSQYAWANPEGIIEIKSTSRGAAQHTFRNFIEFEHKRDDEWTRNVIKVRGGVPAWGNNAVAPLAVASVGIPEIVPDRIAFIATPMIETQAECQRVADYMLNELGEVTRVATGTIVGNPNVRIGQSARLVYLDFDRIDTVTSLESDLDENGYITKVTTGERCPRISGWQHIVPPIYAGTEQSGVYRSTDLGETWSTYNNALPAGDLYAKRIAFNSYDEGMAIINKKLYYNPGGDTPAWSTRTLPAPMNLAGDSPAPGYGSLIAVDALGPSGAFAVLTATSVMANPPPSSGSLETEFRSWVYTCTNSGSTPASWTSTQLVNTLESSEKQYDVYGLDMSSSSGVPYVIASTGSGSGGFQKGQVRVIKNGGPRIRLWFEPFPIFAAVCGDALGSGITDWHVKDISFTNSTHRYIRILFSLELSAPYRDAVFLYGSTGSEHGDYQKCGTTTDLAGNVWNRWEIQTNAGFVSWSEWQVSHIVDVGSMFDPNNTSGSTKMKTQYFNFFAAPYPGHVTDNISQMVYGTSCSAYARGSSPYGHTYHPGLPAIPSAAYPEWSALCAGRIEFG